MKLKFFINSKKEKIYTLKKTIPNSEDSTKDAHYKFIKVRDAPKGSMPEHKRKFSKRN